ncbi:hypothetical protein MPDQ_000486 [Monascus purpureus]|uniref:DUF676 domain-containing protein n=1 Tax=Monascus purpureus TaxID=5098 RepID=A0A507QPL2_MONPU|nr:hypothetical protein MPDQ_000486 [Monascus purpureus]BDD57091.1 hypothetical protein MAP00_002487 [Monascus purpureus]
MGLTIQQSVPGYHLCVLVHGLWGNPSHLDYVAAALRERYPDDKLHILAAKRNAGRYTYDGIELGGERVAYEIEETLKALAETGSEVQKLSIVGYSLGGLVARYALGLLEARGWLDKLEPVNFTTFATPHVGVRTPNPGIHCHIWNVLGARTISMSGRQLFMIDSFRETGRPLLSVLADPESIFIRALTRFKNRSVYANVVNDRSAVFYTTCISATDPFQDLGNSEMELNYVKGYEPVVIDPDVYTLPPTDREHASFALSTKARLTRAISNLPFLLTISFVVPIAMTLFLLNSVVQNFLSRRRIRLHEEGKTGVLFGDYRVPLIIQDMRNAVEDAFQDVNPGQDLNYHPACDSGEFEAEFGREQMPAQSSAVANENLDDRAELPLLQKPSETEDSSQRNQEDNIASENDTRSGPPKLALTPAQFAIIDSLNAVRFRKYPVYIHNHRHSHAAIIVRMPKKGFEEGKIVVKHWLDNEFKV